MADSDNPNEELWREVLTQGHRSRWAALPGALRCAGCEIPMSGIGGSVVRLAIGRQKSRKSPNLCNICDDILPDGGAEVEIAIIFADLRDSTALAERIGPAAFATLLNRFYKIGTDSLLQHNAMIDKMIGDEIMAIFFPAHAGQDFRRAAVLAAQHLAQSLQEETKDGTELPVGVGVHAGLAFVGKIGASGVSDFTALGDTVNTTARLQAEAGPGEVVMSDDIYSSVAATFPDLEKRTVTLRGKEEPFDIRVLSGSN